MKIKTLTPIFAILFAVLFISCKKVDLVNLYDTYMSLSEIEYVSDNYTVNDERCVGKMIYSPNSPRDYEPFPKIIKYKGMVIDTVYNRVSNGNLIIFAVDTEIGDILSVYESQGDNQLAFVNGKKIELELGYAIVDLKIKENYLIFLIASQAYKKYVIYKP